jgi:polar amino acid transport system substrate-binding protein
MTKNLLIILILLAACKNIYSMEYTIMTEELVPLSYMEDNKLKGASVEIVQKMLKKLKIIVKIGIYPWARAYHNIQVKPRHILFSMGRTHKREKKFKWVGPIINTKVFFYKHADSNLKIDNLNDAKKVSTILVSRNFPEHMLLERKGFKNLYITTSPSKNFRMLAGKRGDLVPNIEFTTMPLLKKNNIDPQLIKKTKYVISHLSLYIAMSKDTPDSVVRQWQKVFEEVKNSPFYRKTLKKYIP